MPTKADRKYLDTTVAAFHAQYSSVWGNERWHDSLYPALALPTRHAALVNQFVPISGVNKTLASVSAQDELCRMHFPEPRPREGSADAHKAAIVILERVACTRAEETREASASERRQQQQQQQQQQHDARVLPLPQPIRTPSSPKRDLLSHWNMDAASALCVHVLDVRRDDRVLDLCAAPGGKSLALAQLIFPQLHAAADAEQHPAAAPGPLRGCLHSNELDGPRNKRLAANLRAYLPDRLFDAGALRVLHLDGSDPRAVHQFPCGPGGYDRVLLDAPCSSERRIVQAHVRAAAGGRIAGEMASWRKAGSKTLAKRQAGLLMTALRAVRVGGKVVYSTCSIEAGENDGVIEKTVAALDKERNRFGLSWRVKMDLGSAATKKHDDGVQQAMERWTEETKYGRIAVPDHTDGGQWGPLFFCVITKISETRSC